MMNTIQLAQTISSMVQNGDYVLGHAIFKGRDTSADLPDKILDEGLRIEDASQGVPFTTRCFESDFNECLSNLLDLVSYSCGIVIIISIPKELLESYDSKYFDSANNASVLLESTGEVSSYYHDLYGNPTQVALLPPIYILGYLDVQKDLFIENSSYAFGDGNRNISIMNLKPILDKRYEKVIQEYNRYS